jgi:hypothetical protein
VGFLRRNTAEGGCATRLGAAALLCISYAEVISGGVQTPYTLELEKCYRAGAILDTGMGFVTTRMAKEGIRKDLRVLIVPGAYFASDDEVKKVLQFARDGGTVVMMPTSFMADEYNRRRRYLDPLGIEVTQETVPKYLAKKAQHGRAARLGVRPGRGGPAPASPRCGGQEDTGDRGPNRAVRERTHRACEKIGLTDRYAL